MYHLESAPLASLRSRLDDFTIAANLQKLAPGWWCNKDDSASLWNGAELLIHKHISRGLLAVHCTVKRLQL